MTELTPFAIYLIFTADNLRELFIGALVVSGAVAVFLGIGVCATEGHEPWLIVWCKRLVPVTVAAGLLVALTPSTKTLVAMYGIPALIDGTKAAASSEVGQKAYSAVNKLLDGYLKEKP